VAISMSGFVTLRPRSIDLLSMSSMPSARTVDLQCRADWLEKVDHQVQWNPACSPAAIVE
jgi:hypothetical protein